MATETEGRRFALRASLRPQLQNLVGWLVIVTSGGSPQKLGLGGVGKKESNKGFLNVRVTQTTAFFLLTDLI
jgi:hypothetical protein